MKRIVEKPNVFKQKEGNEENQNLCIRNAFINFIILLKYKTDAPMQIILILQNTFSDC